MARTQLVVTFLLGVVLALSAALVVTSGRGMPEAYGQTAGNNDMIAIMGTMNTGKGPCDNLYMVDSKTMRLAIYQWNGQTLQLMAVRNMTYDMKPEQYPDNNQKPTVAEIRDATRAEDPHNKKPK